MATIISVIGPNEDLCTDQLYDFARRLGRTLVEEGYMICTGGQGGVMEAAFRGAHESLSYRYPRTIGIIPSAQKADANAFSDITVPTGVGPTRNNIVVNMGDVVVALGGGAGTLSELAFAWEQYKPVVLCTAFEGWAQKLADVPIDPRDREPASQAKDISEIILRIKELHP